jgi:hypothetical protein
MTSHLYQVLAISWFVAAAACVDVVVRVGWPYEAPDRWTGLNGWKGVRLASAFLTGFLLSLCPLLFTQLAMGIACIVGFWVVYLAVAYGARVVIRRVDPKPRSIGSKRWSPWAGVVFGMSRAGMFVVAGVAALIAVAPSWTVRSWALLDPVSWLVKTFWGIDASADQILRAGLVVGVTVALATVNLVLASTVLERLLNILDPKTKEPAHSSVSALIGMLERTVITLLAVMGDFTAAGFIAAIKAFGSGRYGKGLVSAEAGVIGTLASVLIAFAMALPARWLLSMGGVL